MRSAVVERRLLRSQHSTRIVISSTLDHLLSSFSSDAKPLDAVQSDPSKSTHHRVPEDYEQLMAQLQTITNARHLMRDIVAEMRLNGIPPTERLLNLGFTANAEINNLRIDDALFFWREIKRHLPRRPGFKSYSTLFDALIKAGRYERADLLLREMEADGVVPSRSQYLPLVTHYSVQGNSTAVKRIVDKMHQLNIPLYQACYAAVIGCYARIPKSELPMSLMEEIGQLMAEEEEEALQAGHHDSRARPLVLNAALDALVAHNMYSGGITLYERFVEERKQIVPDSTTYGLALRCYLGVATGHGSKSGDENITKAELDKRVHEKVASFDSSALEPFVKDILELDAMHEMVLQKAGQSPDHHQQSAASSITAFTDNNNQEMHISILETTAAGSDDSSSSSDSDDSEHSSSSSSSSEEEESDDDEDDGSSTNRTTLAAATRSSVSRAKGGVMNESKMRELHSRALHRARSVVKKQFLAENIDIDAWNKAMVVYDSLNKHQSVSDNIHLKVISTALDLYELYNSHQNTDITTTQLPKPSHDPYTVAAKALQSIEIHRQKTATATMAAHLNDQKTITLCNLLRRACSKEMPDLTVAHGLFRYLRQYRQFGGKGDEVVQSAWRYLTRAVNCEDVNDNEAIVSACELILRLPAVKGVSKPLVKQLKVNYAGQ